MRRYVISALVLLAATAFASAEIIGYHAADDGDGVLTCLTGWDSSNYNLNVDGVLHRVQGLPINGHVVGSFTTDTELDPTVTMINSIDNDTDFAWTQFVVNITMNKTFQISVPQVLNPGDWTVSSYTTNASYDSGLGKWVGQIVFDAGTAIDPPPTAGTLDFKYKMSFIGTVQYCQEMVPVPEPATMSLLAMAGLALIRRGRK